MASDVLTQTLAANQTATFGRGRIFNILAAAQPVSVVADYRAQAPGQASKHKVFNNIPAGSKFTGDPADGDWQYLRVTNGATPQTITIFIGDDDMSFNNAVTVTGTAQVAVSPSSTVATVGLTAVANLTATTIPANASRRRITVCAPVTNTGVVYVQSAGFATPNAGLPLSPGTFAEFDTTASLDVRNDTGAAQNFSTLEET